MPSIFLHGLGQTAASWNGVTAVMENQPDILCPELFAMLPQQDVTYSGLYQAFCQYCAGFSEPFSLCGLSLGGILALQYAIEHPGKVKALALIGAQYAMPKKLLMLQNLIFRFIPDRAFPDTGLRKKDFIRLSNSMMDLNFQGALSGIPCPVLVVCGETDRANKKAALELSQKIPHAQLRILENAGHEVNLDAPEPLGHILNAFFGSVT